MPPNAATGIPARRSTAEPSGSCGKRLGLKLAAPSAREIGHPSSIDPAAPEKLLAERNSIPLAQLLLERHSKMIEATAVDVIPEDEMNNIECPRSITNATN